MKKYLVLLPVVVFAFSYKLNAQILKPIPISYFQMKPQREFFHPFEIIPKSVFYINILNANSGMQFSPEWNFKYTLPKGAIFCRMEDAIYNKLNFWVKFRLGTDEIYSN
jgi:hypothetical protein